jgi:DnaJ-class molecular chaperone
VLRVAAIPSATALGWAVSGLDLKVTHPTPLYNALTGVVIPLEMPDGRILHVSVEEVIDGKMSKTLKGEGMLNRETNTRGDLIVSFDVKFPRKLNQFQKDLLDMALRLPIELTEETHIQRRLLSTGLKLPQNLAPTEREKVDAVNMLMVKRDELVPPE